MIYTWKKAEKDFQKELNYLSKLREKAEKDYRKSVERCVRLSDLLKAALKEQECLKKKIGKPTDYNHSFL